MKNKQIKQETFTKINRIVLQNKKPSKVLYEWNRKHMERNKLGKD